MLKTTPMFKTDEEIDRLIIEFNTSHNINLPTSKVIHEKSYKICKKIAEDVLKEFPNFPEGTDIKANESNIERASVFFDYCDNLSLETLDETFPQINTSFEKYEAVNDLSDIDIIKLYVVGMNRAHIEVWEKHING